MARLHHMELTMPFDLTHNGLERFVQAQDRVYRAVAEELAAEKKTSHWMWFIFPQLKALGRSPMAQHFGIESRDEALGYWQHPVLGPRLKACTRLVLAVREDKTVHDVFGSPDDLKFRSCMTLFAQVAPDEPVFSQALKRFYGGVADELTLKLL